MQKKATHLPLAVCTAFMLVALMMACGSAAQPTQLLPGDQQEQHQFSPPIEESTPISNPTIPSPIISNPTPADRDRVLASVSAPTPSTVSS